MPLSRNHLHDLAMLGRQWLPNVPPAALLPCAQAIAAAEAEVMALDEAAKVAAIITPDGTEAKPAE